MNKQMKARIEADYRVILQSEAGRRVLGGIFYTGRIHGTECMNEFQQGRRSLAVQIANTADEVNSHSVGECMKAYAEMMEESKDDGRDDYGN